MFSRALGDMPPSFIWTPRRFRLPDLSYSQIVHLLPLISTLPLTLSYSTAMAKIPGGPTRTWSISPPLYPLNIVQLSSKRRASAAATLSSPLFSLRNLRLAPLLDR